MSTKVLIRTRLARQCYEGARSNTKGPRAMGIFAMNPKEIETAIPLNRNRNRRLMLRMFKTGSSRKPYFIGRAITAGAITSAIMANMTLPLLVDSRCLSSGRCVLRYRRQPHAVSKAARHATRRPARPRSTHVYVEMKGNGARLPTVYGFREYVEDSQWRRRCL